MASTVAMSPDVLITIKLQVGTENRRFKLPLRDLGANTLPDKLRVLLALPPTKSVVFERYSDSAGTYVTLDSNNPSVYKQLYRAAKAKLKLRIRANIIDLNAPVVETPSQAPASSDRLTSHRYVPPMNPDLVGLNKAPASTNDSEVTLPTALPSIHATGELQRQAYAQFVRNSMSSYVKGLGNSNVIVTTTPKAVEKKPEAPTLTKVANKDEAPLPCSFSDHTNLYSDSSCLSKKIARLPALRAVDQDFHVPAASFTVCCNKCDTTIPDTHWHCSICHDGDYDLCRDCVSRGEHCGVEGHFLIKRSIENGKVISSTTETMPKKVVKTEPTKDIPGAFTTDIKEEEDDDVMAQSTEMSRTCNSCVNVYEESKFDIRGVRHKCMNCPDWDYCSTCVKSARQNHPGHRFAPIYEPISSHPRRSQVHYGINCDGPLCKDKSRLHWIVGDRYKCAVCHNTDFCENCEALPTHRHNRTHPVIKFRTPVRNVSVTTLGEKENGEAMCTMGDRIARTSSKSTETIPAAPSANAATQVQTVAEVKPSEPIKEETEKQEIVEEKIEEEKEEVKEEPKDAESEKLKASTATHLQAHFIADATPDGSKIRMGSTFQQVWVLRNPGPHSWPAGCSVRFIGGDNMLNVDEKHPNSVGDIAQALQSNTINRHVEVNEELAFWVTMKAPQRLGKAISYWRLKAADGTPFGHKLWCDIDVVAPETSVPQVEESETEHVEDVAQETKTETIIEEAKEEPEADEKPSQMIFPKLDKESPNSSTHLEHPAPPSFFSATEEQALPEDMENLELDDDDETDEGFLTDDEYEILDASADEEAINGRK
ncbi:MAG: hypothetical protein MMC33_002555 [Icmadophila ericetorum]|nr:hypothetical protein [Icmadophila ericetorum]